MEFEMTKKARKTIAEHARDVLVENGETQLWAGNPEPCLDAYARTGGIRIHPLNRIKSVIDAARRSTLFVHGGYIRAHDTTGAREILHPVFKLREDE
jgi:hypothetical protein